MFGKAQSSMEDNVVHAPLQAQQPIGMIRHRWLAKPTIFLSHEWRDGGMKLGKRENPEKTPKIQRLPNTIVPLATLGLP